MSQSPFFIVMKTKVYVAYKPCIKPELLVQWNEDDDFMNVTKYGINYYEDEIGYYFIHGELICTID